jgi:SNF2 family DNA or RNA helicase
MATNGLRIKRPYYTGIIGGESLRYFYDGIGFNVRYKNKKLYAIYKKPVNTNVEVVPVKETLKTMCSYIGISPKNCNIEWVYSKGKRNPSKDKLIFMVEGLKKLSSGELYTKYRKIKPSKWTTIRTKCYEDLDKTRLDVDINYLSKMSSVDLFWSEIKSIETIQYDGWIYDFEVLKTHNYVANNILCHNTVSSVGLMCFLNSRGYKGKWIIVTNPSAAFQWVDEIHKFSDLKAVAVVNKSNDHRYAGKDKDKRIAQYKAFMESDKNVLVLTYYNLLHDGADRPKEKSGKRKVKAKDKVLKIGPLLNILKEGDVSVIFDEAHALKSVSPPSQTHRISKALASFCVYKYGLTATPITNNLMDLYGIYSVLAPGYLGKLYQFHENYCKFKDIYIPIGKRPPDDMEDKRPRRRVPKLVGYKNLDHFKDTVYPLYFGHRKTEVEQQLPKLIQKVINIPLSSRQSEVYKLVKKKAIEDLGKIRDESYQRAGMSLDDLDDSHKSTLEHTLVGFIRLQQAANSLELLPADFIGVHDKDSSKIEELVRILKEELGNEKVVIFSKYKNMVNLVGAALKKEGIKYVRITGDEKTQELKHESMKAFQKDPEIQVCLITTAGSASINLQISAYLICLDLPWSLGSLVQLIGRIHRLGSTHNSVVVLFFLAEGTIDYYIYDILKGKKELADYVVDGTDIGELSDQYLKPEDFVNYLEN